MACMIKTSERGIFERKGVFYLDTSYMGTPIRERAGIDLESAKKLLLSRKAAIQEGRYQPRKSSLTLSVKEALEYFYANKQKYLSGARYSKYLLDPIFHYFGDMPVEQLTISLVMEYARHRLRQKNKYDRPLNPNSIFLEISFLNRALNFCVEDQKIQNNPVEKWRRRFKREIHCEDKPVINLDGGKEHGQEWLKLHNAASDHDKRILECLYYTGMRQGEMIKLRWRWVDIIKGIIDLPGWYNGKRITKNGLPRRIPISLEYRNSLLSTPKVSEYVYPQSNKMPYKQWRFDEIRKKAGLDDRITAHVLRKTRATIWDSVSESLSMDALGHVDRQTHKRYAKTTDSELLRLVSSQNKPNKITIKT